jgi:hypothetical protein
VFEGDLLGRFSRGFGNDFGVIWDDCLWILGGV